MLLPILSLQADALTEDGRRICTHVVANWDSDLDDARAIAIARFDQLCAGSGTTVDPYTITIRGSIAPALQLVSDPFPEPDPED